jgi:uncharacterized membrane protein
MSRRHLAILGLILLLAAFFRLNRITGPSLWMDEIWSIEMAMGHGSAHDHLEPNIIHTDQPDLTGLPDAAPWWSICAHLSGVTHPPLYFVILRWWIDLFGTGAAATRSLSAIFSLAAVALFFDVGRILHGPRQALLAAAISALAIAQIDFAQEARSYPMLIFFGLCCADLVVRSEFLGVSRRRLILLAACVFAAALTHYLSAGALLALGVYTLVRLRGRARWQTLSAVAAGGILALAIWIPLFISQKQTLPSLSPTFLREARVSDHLKLTLYRIIGLPAEFLVGERGGEAMNSSAVLAIFLFTIPLPLIRLIYRRDLLLWVLWALGTIGFVAALDLAHQTTLVGYLRYTILASPAIYAVVATFDWPRRALLRDTLAFAFICILGIVAVRRSRTDLSAKEDWRDLSNAVDTLAQPDDLLVFYNADPWVSSGTWFMGLKYYSPASHHPWLILNDRADIATLRQLQSRSSLWLIGLNPESKGDWLLPGWMPQWDTVYQDSAGGAVRMIPVNYPQPSQSTRP